MKKLICFIFGHNYRYNFKSLPNKCICKRCKSKFVWNYTGIPFCDRWDRVGSFPNEKRTDSELIKQWIS